MARRNISGKPRLDPADLVCHRRSRRAAGIKAGILQEQNSVTSLAHAGHGFSRHFRRYRKVHLATDYKQRTPGSLLTGSVPGEEFLHKPIVLPTRFEHSARELRLCLSSAGLRDMLVRRKRLLLQHVAHLKLSINGFDVR